MAALLIAAPFLIQGVEASRSHYAPHSAISTESILPAPINDETNKLSIDARVELHARQRDETLRETELAHRQIAEAKSQLAKAQLDTQTLPDQIKKLSDEIARIDNELPAAVNAIHTAQRESDTFLASVPARMLRTQQQANSTRETQYANAVDQIALARRQRNELRARIGAQREDQEEVIHTLRERRKAQQRGDAIYAATLQREESNIAAEADVVAHHLADTQAAFQRLTAAQHSAKQELAHAQKALADATITLSSAPSLIASFEIEINRLAQLKATCESEYQIARREQQQRDEEVALAEANAQEAASRQLESASPQTAASYAPDRTTWASASGNPHASPSLYSNLPSIGSATRYYDPGYRPPVGHHYVSGHFRRDGAYVQGHYKTNSDDSFWNNWSSAGNRNPFTGKTGSTLPSRNSAGGSSYVQGYFRSNGTYVSGHYRRK